MFQLVSADWVQPRLSAPEYLVLDPRSPVRYMAGHLENAVNLPVVKAFDPEAGLLSVEKLESWLGAAGLDASLTPVIYDAADGRNAAMLAWILLYLGRNDVHLMEILLERWVADSREIFYKPVAPRPRNFAARVQPGVRANGEQVAGASRARLVDFRSGDEFTGKLDTENKPGHIPGAVNLPWQQLLGDDQRLLAPPEELRGLMAAAGIAPGDEVVAYCRSGLRAAVGYLALALLGYKVRLYDGSYADWVRSGRPVERIEAAGEAAR
jgi:thiosulfate/3-mercaptopyruvate sulfurtransferase